MESELRWRQSPRKSEKSNHRSWKDKDRDKWLPHHTSNLMTSWSISLIIMLGKCPWIWHWNNKMLWIMCRERSMNLHQMLHLPLKQSTRRGKTRRRRSSGILFTITRLLISPSWAHLRRCMTSWLACSGLAMLIKFSFWRTSWRTSRWTRESPSNPTSRGSSKSRMISYQLERS